MTPAVDEIRWEGTVTVDRLLALIEADPIVERAIVLALQELQRANETRAINLSDEERTRVLKAKVLPFNKRGKNR